MEEMSLLDRTRGNPLHKLGVRELREEEIRLNSQLDQIRKEIDEIEKEKKKRFREAVAAVKRQIPIRTIASLDMEAGLKLRNHTMIYRQLKFVRNLLIVKNNEQQLKDVGLWKKLTAMSRAELERFLMEEIRQGPDMGEEVAEVEKEIVDIWERAGSELSIDRELQKEEA